MYSIHHVPTDDGFVCGFKLRRPRWKCGALQSASPNNPRHQPHSPSRTSANRGPVIHALIISVTERISYGQKCLLFKVLVKGSRAKRKNILLSDDLNNKYLFKVYDASKIKKQSVRFWPNMVLQSHLKKTNRVSQVSARMWTSSASNKQMNNVI